MRVDNVQGVNFQSRKRAGIVVSDLMKNDVQRLLYNMNHETRYEQSTNGNCFKSYILGALKIENKALSKKDSIEKYQFWGLVIFVGIPLPGTGAWTGSLIAALLNMDKKKSILAIFLGMLMASIIMLIVSYGIVKSII